MNSQTLAAPKMALCESALVEARRLCTTDVEGPTLNQILGRVNDLLDDLDEILVAVPPTERPDLFSRAAWLHRELELIQTMRPRPPRKRTVF